MNDTKKARPVTITGALVALADAAGLRRRLEEDGSIIIVEPHGRGWYRLRGEDGAVLVIPIVEVNGRPAEVKRATVHVKQSESADEVAQRVWETMALLGKHVGWSIPTAA